MEEDWNRPTAATTTTNNRSNRATASELSSAHFSTDGQSNNHFHTANSNTIERSSSSNCASLKISSPDQQPDTTSASNTSASASASCATTLGHNNNDNDNDNKNNNDSKMMQGISLLEDYVPHHHHLTNEPRLHTIYGAEERIRLGRELEGLSSMVGPNDVLCGRSKMSFNHTGNKRFRDAITSSLADYSRAESRMAKSLVVLSIFDRIRTRGGRFWKKNPGSGQWYQLSDQQTKEKIAHAVRDAVNSMEARRTKKTHKQQQQQQLQAQFHQGFGQHSPALVGMSKPLGLEGLLEQQQQASTTMATTDGLFFASNSSLPACGTGTGVDTLYPSFSALGNNLPNNNNNNNHSNSNNFYQNLEEATREMRARATTHHEVSSAASQEPTAAGLHAAFQHKNVPDLPEFTTLRALAAAQQQQQQQLEVQQQQHPEPEPPQQPQPRLLSELLGREPLVPTTPATGLLAQQQQPSQQQQALDPAPMFRATTWPSTKTTTTNTAGSAMDNLLGRLGPDTSVSSSAAGDLLGQLARTPNSTATMDDLLGQLNNTGVSADPTAIPSAAAATNSTTDAALLERLAAAFAVNDATPNPAAVANQTLQDDPFADAIDQVLGPLPDVQTDDPFARMLARHQAQ